MSIKIVLKMVLLSVVLFATSAHSMNKAELIDAIAKDAGLKKADAKKALEAILDSSVQTYLKKGSTVLLPFGKIKQKKISRKFSANGHVTVLKSAKPPHEYVGHVTLLKSVATTAYPDSFFDIFPSELSLIIETRLSNTLYSSEDNHNRLYNSALYHHILFGYIYDSNPLLMSYVHCVSADGINDDCGSIRKELHRLLQDPIALMREQTRLDPDSDGDTIPDTSSKFEFTVLPDRVELLIRETTTRALDVYLDKIAENIIEAVKRGQNNETDYAFILRQAAKMTGIEKTVIKRVSNSFSDIATNALKKGDTVSLVGFGSFSVSQRAARVGRNPQTGKAIQIKAKNVVKFKAGADLSKKVN